MLYILEFKKIRYSKLSKNIKNKTDKKNIKFRCKYKI